MKYIITENEKAKLKVIRRLYQDEALITSIIEEGLELFDPCDFKILEKYSELVFKDSSRTYLLHYLTNENEEPFPYLFKNMIEYLRSNYYNFVEDYWEDKIEDCENFYDELYNN